MDRLYEKVLMIVVAAVIVYATTNLWWAALAVTAPMFLIFGLVELHGRRSRADHP